MKITYMTRQLKAGGFMAYCPSMKPVKVYGETEEEAASLLATAARTYVKLHPEFAEKAAEI